MHDSYPVPREPRRLSLRGRLAVAGLGLTLAACSSSSGEPQEYQPTSTDVAEPGTLPTETLPTVPSETILPGVVGGTERLAVPIDRNMRSLAGRVIDLANTGETGTRHVTTEGYATEGGWQVTLAVTERAPGWDGADYAEQRSQVVFKPNSAIDAGNAVGVKIMGSARKNGPYPQSLIATLFDLHMFKDISKDFGYHVLEHIGSNPEVKNQYTTFTAEGTSLPPEGMMPLTSQDLDRVVGTMQSLLVRSQAGELITPSITSPTIRPA